jgi:hypothetical protein
MQVNKWGKNAWEFLHTTTFNYPETPTNEDKLHYKTFFNSLDFVLPCKYCQNSFQIYTKYIPIDYFLDDRMGLTYWLFIIHNLINAKLGNQLETFENVVIKYEKCRAKCGKITNENKKEILTCQIKAQEVDKQILNEFINKTFDKYNKIIEKCVKKLYSSDDNPNK